MFYPSVNTHCGSKNLCLCENSNAGKAKFNKFYLITMRVARFYRNKHFMVMADQKVRTRNLHMLVELNTRSSAAAEVARDAAI